MLSRRHSKAILQAVSTGVGVGVCVVGVGGGWGCGCVCASSVGLHHRAGFPQLYQSFCLHRYLTVESVLSLVHNPGAGLGAVTIRAPCGTVLSSHRRRVSRLLSLCAGGARRLPAVLGVLQHQRPEERPGHRRQLLPEHHARRVQLCRRFFTVADPETHSPGTPPHKARGNPCLQKKKSATKLRVHVQTVHVLMGCRGTPLVQLVLLHFCYILTRFLIPQANV